MKANDIIANERALNDAHSHRCPNCLSHETRVFYTANSVPTNSCILLKTRDEALAYSRGDIRLMFCKRCGFISNLAFNPELTEYSGRYEETQGFSETFSKFHEALAATLIQRHDLHNKTVLEIGCGKGEFLALLSRLGNNRGIGFDPSYVDGRHGLEQSQLTFVKDYYSEKYAEFQADFVCCKMTLEHIHETADFIGGLRRALSENDRATVFFQIPDAIRILAETAFEDIYYEHCSYFTAGSLKWLFSSNGFSVLNVDSLYQGQYLSIEATSGGPESRQSHADLDDEDIEGLVDGFAQRCRGKVDEWRQLILDLRREGKRIVLWGSGSKGVAFLTALSIGDSIEYVVDINPYRQGYFMAGTGQEIVSPDFLVEYAPDVIIVMNRVYCDEIQQSIGHMGVTADVMAV